MWERGATLLTLGAIAGLGGLLVFVARAPGPADGAAPASAGLETPDEPGPTPSRLRQTAPSLAAEPDPSSRRATPAAAPGGAAAARVLTIAGPVAGLRSLGPDGGRSFAIAAGTGCPRIELAPCSDRAAIAHVLTGKADAALSGVAPSQAERRAAVGTRRVGELVVVLVSSRAPLNLSARQVRRVLTGEIEDWTELNAGAGPIEVLRPADRAIADRFATMLVPGDRVVVGTPVDDPRKIVGRVRSEPNAIGLVPLAAVDDRRLAIAIDGVHPSPAAFRLGQYPYGFTLRAVYHGRPAVGLQRFLDALRSPAGKAVLGEWICIE